MQNIYKHENLLRISHFCYITQHVTIKKIMFRSVSHCYLHTNFGSHSACGSERALHLPMTRRDSRIKWLFPFAMWIFWDSSLVWIGLQQFDAMKKDFFFDVQRTWNSTQKNREANFYCPSLVSDFIVDWSFNFFFLISVRCRQSVSFARLIICAVCVIFVM